MCDDFWRNVRIFVNPMLVRKEEEKTKKMDRFFLEMDRISIVGDLGVTVLRGK